MSLLRMRCKVQSSFERVNFVEAEGMEEIENDGDIGVRSSLLYIEQELRTLGLPSVLSQENDDANSELSDTKAVVVLQKLLSLHRHNLKIIEDQRDSLTRGKSDVLLQREAQARLKEDIRSGERELARLEDKERQLNHKIKVLSSKLRAEQDEVRKLKTSMQYKETQRTHESKKKEKEFERLKQKLGQLVLDKNRDRLGMSMPNALQKTDGKRKVWLKPGSGDEDMYRAIISSYEEKQKELMLENASLRESLAGMETQLVSILNERQLLQEQSHESNGTELAVSNGANLISNGHFQMPYDLVRDGIEHNFQEKCQLVKKHIDDLNQRIERLEASACGDFTDTGSEVRKLEHKLSDYRIIIGQQEEMLLQKSLNSNEERSELLSDSHLWHEQTRLGQERQLFKQQKENYERERQKFMEAVHQLDSEKHSFEDVMAAFSRDQEGLLNSTQELDSFFTKLCSTPSNQSCNMSKYMVRQADGSTGASPSSSLLQDSISACGDADLKQDLSMCSDDGSSVLNQRPTTPPR